MVFHKTMGALAVAALLVTASGPAAASPAHQAAAKTITLSNHDGGRTVSLSTGDHLQVRLTSFSENGMRWMWSVPTASDPHGLSRESGKTTPSGDAVAVFTATEAGSGTITAQRHCMATQLGHLCPHLVIPWNVTVTTH